jgi:tetratricopeptide (TPR) repeat protein
MKLLPKKIRSKNIILLVIIWFTNLLFINATQLNAVGDSAVIYYTNKDYAKTISFYTKILQEGKHSWRLHFNLGNAYFKSNQLGLAILHYEKALKINPIDEDILNNIKVCDSKLIDKMEVKDNFFENKVRFGLLHFFNLDGWAWVSIFSLFLGFLFYFIFSNAFNTRAKKFYFWTAGLMFIFCVFSLVFGYSALKEKQTLDKAVIISSVINQYKEPNLESKKSDVLHEGTRLRILNFLDGWVNVSLLNGNEVWLKKSDISVY